MIDTKRFRAATRFTNENNGNAKSGWLIAADIGYSSVKVMSPTTSAIFPSFAIRMQSQESTVLSYSDDRIEYKDLETGERWLVGRDAQNKITSRNTNITSEEIFGRERYTNPMFKVVASVGLGIGLTKGTYGGPGNQEILLMTGFPPMYESDNEDLLDVLSGHHHFSLKIGAGKEREYDFEIKRKNITIMPQPLGTLYSATMAADNKKTVELADCMQKNVLIFDAGFGTLDVYPIERGEICRCQTNNNLGMRRVLQDTCDEIKHKLKVEVTVPSIIKQLETGKVRYAKRTESRDIEFGDILETASNRVCDEAINWLIQVYQLDEYDYFIVTGGTGAAWYNRLKETLKGMETLHVLSGNVSADIPLTMANVRGYYKFGTIAN